LLYFVVGVFRAPFCWSRWYRMLTLHGFWSYGLCLCGESSPNITPFGVLIIEGFLTDSALSLDVLPSNTYVAVAGHFCRQLH
jgi:hypothetical protein